MTSDEPTLAISSEGKTSQNILFRQVREVLQYFLMRHARRKVRQHVIDGNPHTANTGLTAALARLNCDNIAILHSCIIQFRVDLQICLPRHYTLLESLSLRQICPFPSKVMI